MNSVSILIYVSFACFVFSTIITYVTILICNKKEIYDRVDGRKLHTGNVPRLGGIGVCLSAVLGYVAYHTFMVADGWSMHELAVAAGFFVIFITGLVDDLFDMRAKVKFLFQIFAALLVIFGTNSSYQIFDLHLPAVVSKILIFMWIIGLTNAYNLIDGMDWLCSGLVFYAFVAMGIIFAWADSVIGALYFILAFSVSGFMVWNKPKAKIFLGDSGSMTLGFLVAVLPLFRTNCDRLEFNKFFIMLILSSIPVTDVIAAIWRREREHRSFLSPDRGHVHHKLINIGFSRISILVLMHGLQALLGLSAVLSTFVLSKEQGMVLLICTFVFVLIAFSVLHYVNRYYIKHNKGILNENPNL